MKLNQKGYMETFEVVMWAIVMAIIGLIVFAIVFVVQDHRWYRGGGQHKGFVTAVDCSQGGLSQYCTVYFKTSLDTTQEDKYYTELNAPILDELRSAQENKENITLEYDHIIMRGISKMDGDYIRSIK